MAGRVPPEFIDELLARTDIVDLINRRVPLRKGGKDYQACCPFHDEKTPSFTVSREKQFYHCFGCGAHGTAIGFLMDYEHQGFIDAVEELADEAGIDVPRMGEAAHQGPDPRPLYTLTEQAANLFRKQLRQHPNAAQAVDYLKGRGLSGEIAATFGIGYAPPGWDFLLTHLGSDDEARKQLIQCGLVIDQDGRRYDRFRERIIFPIRDRRGRYIGFGGRILGEGKPKYLNSPETPIFHKGRELYGLYEALQSNRILARLLVVEGYMDVIALAQFGISYAVATLGTSTTADHLRQLLPQTPELVFCFDGDRAGRDAAWKALEISLTQATGQQQLRFLFLPDGEDPDTLIREEGREAFEHRIQHAPTLSELLFERLADQVDMSSLDGKARLAALASPLISRVPPSIFRDMLNKRLADLVGVAAPRLETRQAMMGRPTIRRPTHRATMNRQATTPLRLAIALVLQHPRLASAANVANDWRRLEKPGISLLSELIDLIATHPDITPAAITERWRDRASYSHLQRLANPQLLDHIPKDGLEAEMIGALKRLLEEDRATRNEDLFNRESTAEWSEEEKAMLRRSILTSDRNKT